MRCPSDKMLEKTCAILNKNSHGVFKPSPEEIQINYFMTKLKPTLYTKIREYLYENK